jgi:predicted enzyme related to lactoylglutathione lyase
MSDIAGRFIWYETLTTDVDGAIAFYTKVMGWGTERWDGMDTPYHMWANGGRPIGGLMQLPPGAEAPPHWLGYIGTDDVAATTAHAEALGAKVLLRCMTVPTVGTMSVLQDPQGAFFAAYTPDTPMPVPPPGVGDISWHEIATTDIDACLAFYSALFGWKTVTTHDLGAMGMYLEYGVGTDVLGGIYRKPDEMPAPPHFMYYIRLSDLDAAVARVKDHGGRVLHGPVDVPGGDKVAMCTDPQGAAFAIHWKKD